MIISASSKKIKKNQTFEANSKPHRKERSQNSMGKLQVSSYHRRQSKKTQARLKKTQLIHKVSQHTQRSHVKMMSPTSQISKEQLYNRYPKMYQNLERGSSRHRSREKPKAQFGNLSSGFPQSTKYSRAYDLLKTKNFGSAELRGEGIIFDHAMSTMVTSPAHQIEPKPGKKKRMHKSGYML